MQAVSGFTCDLFAVPRMEQVCNGWAQVLVRGKTFVQHQWGVPGFLRWNFLCSPTCMCQWRADKCYMHSKCFPDLNVGFSPSSGYWAAWCLHLHCLLPWVPGLVSLELFALCRLNCFPRQLCLSSSITERVEVQRDQTRIQASPNNAENPEHTSAPMADTPRTRKQIPPLLPAGTPQQAQINLCNEDVLHSMPASHLGWSTSLCDCWAEGLHSEWEKYCSSGLRAIKLRIWKICPSFPLDSGYSQFFWHFPSVFMVMLDKSFFLPHHCRWAVCAWVWGLADGWVLAACRMSMWRFSEQFLQEDHQLISSLSRQVLKEAGCFLRQGWRTLRWQIWEPMQLLCCVRCFSSWVVKGCTKLNFTWGLN